jgi:flagellar capping protein FliD
MVKRHKKEVFEAIVRYGRFVKSYSKVRVIAVIHNRFERQLKHTVFAKLARCLIASNSKHSINREVRDLKTQLQDMTVQLENKNESIQRL